MPYNASNGRSYCVAVPGSGACPGKSGVSPGGVGTVRPGCQVLFRGSSGLEVPANPMGDVQLVVPSAKLLECRKLVRGSRARPMAAPNCKAWFFLVQDRSSTRLWIGTWKLWL